MKLLLLSFLLHKLIEASYDEAQIVCALIPYTESFEDNLSYLWGKAIMQPIDRYCYLVISPILIIFQIVSLAFYCDNPKVLGKPGILFCVIIVFEMVLSLHFLISAIYFTIQHSTDVMPSSFPPFCEVNSIFTTFFQSLHLIFLFIVPLYIVYVLRSTLKSNSKIWNLVYVFIFIISGVATYLLWDQGFLGLNIFGLCGVTFIRFPNPTMGIPIAIIVFNLVFIGAGIFTIRYFKRHMPNSLGLRKKKRYQKQILVLYVVGFAAFWTCESVIVILLYLNCKQTNPDSGFFPLITLFNLLRLTQCFFIYFVIFKSQNVRRSFKKFLKKIFSKSNKTHQLKKMDSLSLQTSTNPNEEVFNFQSLLLDIQQQNNNIDILKISQMVTIVSGIYIAYKEYYNIKGDYFNPCTIPQINSSTALQDINHDRNITNTNYKGTKKIFFHEKMSIKINIQIIKDFITDLSLIPQLGILECTMILHAPKVFQQMLQNDRLQSIFQSFELHDNTRKMFDLVQGQGGKSGQFFFFSADNKYVLKTITPDQFQFIDSNLLYFHQHFTRNPDSVLAKIYGLFTFKGDQIQRTYHLIMMKNIRGCTNDQIKRTYDLKGSRYDRQVNIQDTYANELQKVTLKDIDFMKQQGRIHVNNQKKLKLRDIITKDTIFLKNLNLIDYSLLVIKVNWLVPPKNPLFWGHYQRIQSCLNKHEFYHIGVIDYLQRWDLQKKGQKWWKNLIGKKDISAQQPKKYQHRFVTFISQVTEQFCLRQMPNKQYEKEEYQFNKQVFDDNLIKLKRLQRQVQYFKQELENVQQQKKQQQIGYRSANVSRRQIEMSVTTRYVSEKANQEQILKNRYNDSDTIRIDSPMVSQRSDSSGQPLAKIGIIPISHQQPKQQQNFS